MTRSTGGLGPDRPDSLNVPDDEGDPIPNNGLDILYGNAGNDTIYGADDNDEIYGDSGNDTLDGGIDDDLVNGGRGDDLIIGGQGDDTLFGGKGADTFGFAAGDGSDVITDFAVGTDAIALTGLTTDDLFLSQEESAVVISAEGLRITLEDTDLAELEDAGFLV